MSKTNQDVCHDFFYDRGGHFMPRYKNVGYSDDTFYSYDTAIAKLVTNKFGDTVCLMSCEGFSNTTRKQMSYLCRACPFSILYVPVSGGEVAFDSRDVLAVALGDLAYWKTKKMSQQCNRTAFSRSLNQLKVYMDNFDVNLTDEQQLLLAEHEKFNEGLLEIESKLAEKRVKRQDLRLAREKQKRAEMEEMFQKLLKESSYLSIVEAAYNNSFPITPQRKYQLREMLNSTRIYSFVWATDESYCTSQGVKVNKREGDILLKLLHKNKLQHGHKIDRYTVMSVTEDHVKIGCHLIPRQNLEELYKAIA